MAHVLYQMRPIRYATTQKLPKLKFELCANNEKQ